MQIKFNTTKHFFERAIKLATVGLVGFVVIDNHKYTKIDLEKCKKEIYTTDSNRYNRFNKSYVERNRYTDYKAWDAERDRMLDSIEKLGTAHKAYFEGGNKIK